MSFWWRLFGRIPCLRRRVIVNLKAGTHAVEGVLFAQQGTWLVLKDARFVPVTGEPKPMDGDVIIECANVDFIQAFGS